MVIKMIDLHIHTTHSDGSDDVITVLKEAELKRLKIISITDHDTCSAYNELKKIDVASYFKGEIIQGVELKTIVDGYQIELLGYNVDTDCINNEVHKYYIKQRDKRTLEKDKLKTICENIGVKLDKIMVDEYNPYDEYAGNFIYKQIRKYPENKHVFPNGVFPDNFNDFYRLHMSNPSSPFFIDMRDVIPEPHIIVNIIRKSGGLTFIPHPFVYGENSHKIINHLLENYKIDGIECYYHDHTEDETNFLIKLCKEKGLLMSGGSDYHGVSRPHISIGSGQGNLAIKSDIIKDWYDKDKLFKQ